MFKYHKRNGLFTIKFLNVNIQIFTKWDKQIRVFIGDKLYHIVG